jgi:hypothetical protein
MVMEFTKTAFMADDSCRFPAVGNPVKINPPPGVFFYLTGGLYV